MAPILFGAIDSNDNEKWDASERRACCAACMAVMSTLWSFRLGLEVALKFQEYFHWPRGRSSENHHRNVRCCGTTGLSV